MVKNEKITNSLTKTKTKTKKMMKTKTKLKLKNNWKTKTKTKKWIETKITLHSSAACQQCLNGENSPPSRVVLRVCAGWVQNRRIYALKSPKMTLNNVFAEVSSSDTRSWKHCDVKSWIFKCILVNTESRDLVIYLFIIENRTLSTTNYRYNLSRNGCILSMHCSLA